MKQAFNIQLPLQKNIADELLTQKQEILQADKSHLTTTLLS